MAVRAVLGILAIVFGILVPTGIAVVPAVLGAKVAYDGPDSRGIVWTAALLAVVELAFALDIGVLSLSYLVAAGVLVLAGRLVAIGPWSAVDGWNLSDALRAIMVSSAAALVIIGSSVLVGGLYGNDQLVQRVDAQLNFARLGPLVLACATFVLVLRRVDMPFRRQIHFGT